MNFLKKILNIRDKSVDIGVNEFSDKMKIKDAILVDIRTPVEFQNLRIKDANNIDYYGSDFQKNISKLEKDKTILIYCRSGNRSYFAVNKMKKMGFSNSFHLEGGIVDWIKNDKPVVM